MTDSYYGQFPVAAAPAMPAGIRSGVSLIPSPARSQHDRLYDGLAGNRDDQRGGWARGRRVMQTTLEGVAAGEHRQELDMSGVPQGAYIITVATAGGLTATRLHVVR